LSGIFFILQGKRKGAAAHAERKADASKIKALIALRSV
jgi:hypothetical protein